MWAEENALLNASHPKNDNLVSTDERDSNGGGHLVAPSEIGKVSNICIPPFVRKVIKASM